MPFAQTDYLPSYEELSSPEINMSSAPLKAGARHFGRYCDQQSKEFMLCNAEEKDPRKCVSEGKDVTKCALDFFNKLRLNCADEFGTYWKCLDHSGHNMSLGTCTKQQRAFDKCVLDKLGQEEPEIGYFSRVRVHHTKRPMPKHELNLPEPLPDLPDPHKVPPPESVKLGSRFAFY